MDPKKLPLLARLTPRGETDPDFRFEQPDWMRFLHPETLGQKAGVPKDQLRRLVLKELTDNALDAGAPVTAKQTGPDTYVIEDDGPGFPGTPEEIARLFSVNRPLISTKLLRLPTRGALGMGLRVVAGAVVASGGQLIVTTHDRQLHLMPQPDGTTAVRAAPVDYPKGARIEITFGDSLPKDPHALYWAELAIALAHNGTDYQGKSSPYWYDPAEFYTMCQTARPSPSVRDFIGRFDGCTGAKAGTIAAPFKGRDCASLTPKEAADLLSRARDATKPVKPERLGGIGRGNPFLPEAYATKTGTVPVGGGATVEVPCRIEVWASHLDGTTARLSVFVNRTPIASDTWASLEKTTLNLYGCGLNDEVLQAGRRGLALFCNVTTPFMPITSDGKEPDLGRMAGILCETIQTAVQRLKRQAGPTDSKKMSQKDAVLFVIEDAIGKASDGGFRFSIRQLYYVVRPMVARFIGKDIEYKTFTRIIDDYENTEGEIEFMVRDARGTMLHPHGGETTPLGTLAVEDYERPPYRFNKVLFVEKEGFAEALQSAGWPERHDCAILSCKGYPTRAAKDLIDFIGKSGEPVTVFAIHDADADGTMIIQSLREATRARGPRRIKIVNLGLEPWEAVAMGLEVETLESKERRPVAEYVKERTDHDWGSWLQAHRVELNALTTRRLVEWLDTKMTEHGGRKLVPPADIVCQEVATLVEDELRSRITERIRAEANLEARIRAAMASIQMPGAAEIASRLAAGVETDPLSSWRDQAKTMARGLATRSQEICP